MDVKIVDTGHCLKCGVEIPSDKLTKGYICSCGSTSVILSDYKTEGNNILCPCGNKEFTLVAHMNFTHKGKHIRACSRCNHHITIDVYKDY